MEELYSDGNRNRNPPWEVILLLLIFSQVKLEIVEPAMEINIHKYYWIQKMCSDSIA